MPAKKKATASKKTASANASAKESAPKKRGRPSKKADEDEEMEDVDEVEEESIEVAPKKGKASSKAAPKPKAAPKGRGKKSAPPPPESEEEEEEEEAEEESEEEVEEEKEPIPPPKKASAKRASKAAPAKKSVAIEIPDTQQTPVKAATPSEDSDLEAPTPQPAKRASIVPASKATKASRPSEVPSILPQSDLEARFAKLQLDYKELASTRLTEPEKALEAFKRTTTQRQKASESALAALQENIQDQSTLPGEIRALNKAAAKKDAEIAVLKGKLAAMAESLEELRSENTMLSSKLAARTANPPPQVTVPGSAKKPSLGRNGLPMGGMALGAADWKAEAKENLYGDLCNLAILNVTKEKLQEEGDDEPMPYLVYECLQQTRNGSECSFLFVSLAFTDITIAFHFKLKYAESGEDRVTFQPLLDPKRDAKIIACIPEYMTDEIEFQKKSLCSFYEKLTTQSRRQLNE